MPFGKIPNKVDVSWQSKSTETGKADKPKAAPKPKHLSTAETGLEAAKTSKKSTAPQGAKFSNLAKASGLDAKETKAAAKEMEASSTGHVVSHEIAAQDQAHLANTVMTEHAINLAEQKAMQDAANTAKVSVLTTATSLASMLAKLVKNGADNLKNMV